MKTTIILEIEHKKDLPSRVPLVDIIAQRTYGYIYSQGCEVGVTARLQAVPAIRCVGHGAGPSGDQNRSDCTDCARRLAPRAGAQLMVPPEEFPCPERIAA